jgi:hypothetical protein
VSTRAQQLRNGTVDYVKLRRHPAVLLLLLHLQVLDLCVP